MRKEQNFNIYIYIYIGITLIKLYACLVSIKKGKERGSNN